MALTSRQIIRILIGDRLKTAVKEKLGYGDGTNKTFAFDMFPVVSNSIKVYDTGVGVATANYAITFDTGKLEFVAAPTANATLYTDYNYVALSDEEIDELMSGVGTGKPLLVAANCAMALAADASRYFSYVMGDKEINKNDIGNKLLKLAQELEKKHYEESKYTHYTGTVATLADLPTGSPYYDYDTGTSLDDD